MSKIVRRRLKSSAVSGGAVIMALAWASCAFAGAVNSSAAAPPATGSNTAETKQVDEPPMPATPGCGSTPTSDLQKAVPGASVTARELTGDEVRAPEAASGPAPQWVCAAPAITLEPLWSGKQIEAVWVIKNEGEGDLVIKLKGG
ncbi:MAG: hypothetical protein V2A79_12575 [Planctomycetota bacterium]